MNRDSIINLNYSSGERSSDQLKRNEFNFAYRLQNFISKAWDSQVKAFTRKNFTSNDNGLSWTIGYFSKVYEIILDTEYSIQNNNDETTTHPTNVDFNLTRFFSKEFFASLSFQKAADENVTILGAFIKMGYRFGNQELSPLRDGAAPRGSL